MWKSCPPLSTETTLRVVISDTCIIYSEAIMKRATNVARKNLISLGTCIGKFTKAGKFHLQVTALGVLAPYAKVSNLAQLLSKEFTVHHVISETTWSSCL